MAKRPKAIHYAGEIRAKTARGFKHVGAGWAACCSGDRAYKIRAAKTHTYRPEQVTCKPCRWLLMLHLGQTIRPVRYVLLGNPPMFLNVDCPLCEVWENGCRNCRAHHERLQEALRDPDAARLRQMLDIDVSALGPLLDRLEELGLVIEREASHD